MSPAAPTEDEGKREAPQPIQYPFMNETAVTVCGEEGRVLNVNMSTYTPCVSF